MGMVHGPNVVTDGLHRYFDAGNVQSYSGSGTTAYDLVTKYAMGINGPTYSSANGGYFTYAGTSDHYIDNDNTGQMALFTLSAWVYNQSGGDSLHSLLNSYWEIHGTTLAFFSYDFANDYWRVSAGGTVPYDEWTFITTTWDGSKIRHYFNGSIGWDADSNSSGTSQNLATIGGYTGRKFKGRVALLYVHTVALTAAEVLQNYNAHKSRFGL
jgi:hypothetical protein